MTGVAKAARTALRVLCLCVIIQLISCAAPNPPPQTPTPIAGGLLPTPTLQVDVSPTQEPMATDIAPDSGWITLRPGMERRTLNITDENGEWQESITVLRLTPALFHFDVLYSPGEARSISAWQTQSGALLVVNGGFFTEEHHATGLVISDGKIYGRSYEGFGGMFAVNASGPQLRWLPEQPYNPDEPLRAALQSFPMLLTPGGVPAIDDDGRRARRTVIAQDSEGRIVFLVANFGHFTLYGLSRYLQNSDLALEVALNLDGGASSGLLLADPELFVPAFEQLPTVIVVRVRD